MDRKHDDGGTIAALMIRLREERIPRAKRMLEKVNRGERIGDSDLEFLKRVYDDSRKTRKLLDRNPEYEELLNRFVSLYTEIVEKALTNEEASR